MITLLLCLLLTIIDITSSATYYIRNEGCDHNGATCESPWSNFTALCNSNSQGSGLSPDECGCCEPDHPCNDDFGLKNDINGRRLLNSNHAKFGIIYY